MGVRNRLYVVGPVSGMDGLNRDAFLRAKDQLEASGYTVVIPHDVVKETDPWPIAMRKSILAMLTCRGVAHLDCKPSSGSLIEVNTAFDCGMPVKHVSEWIKAAQ